MSNATGIDAFTSENSIYIYHFPLAITHNSMRLTDSSEGWPLSSLCSALVNSLSAPRLRPSPAHPGHHRVYSSIK